MDNLRYISLQYIKGDNYEKIQCFKYEEIMELLVYIKESRDYSKERLKDLKDAKEKEKCIVGESFLNDLVNYYNFTDIRDAIDDITEGNIVIVDKMDKLIKKLDKIIEKIEGIGGGTIAGLDGNDDFKNSYDEFIKLSKKLGITIFKEWATVYKPGLIAAEETKRIKYVDNVTLETGEALAGLVNNLIANKGHVVDVNQAREQVANTAANPHRNLNRTIALAKKNDDDARDTAKEVFNGKPINDFYTYLLDNDIKTDDIKTKIMDTYETLLPYNGTTEHLIILLKILKEVLKFEEEKNNVMVLFKIYRKICVSNIAIFDKLFTKTDISSIDDAFMIKSYAVFLDKLEKIKKSLEGKDLTKQERGLSNTLERLFDLYGINDPDGIIKDTEKSKYLYEHIVQ